MQSFTFTCFVSSPTNHPEYHKNYKCVVRAWNLQEAVKLAEEQARNYYASLNYKLPKEAVLKSQEEPQHAGYMISFS